MHKKIDVIILSGGKGTRFGSNVPKQYQTVNNKTVLEITISKFNRNNNINNIYIVAHNDWIEYIKKLELSDRYEKVHEKVIPGGSNRRLSAYRGLKFVKSQQNTDKVLIHDAVRPLVSHSTINNCVNELSENDAVYPAVRAVDTLIYSENTEYIDKVPNRNFLHRGQTPQGFKLEKILQAHELAKSDPHVDFETTNDCGLIMRYNICPVKITRGNYENFKVTYREDLDYLRYCLNKGE